MDHSSRGSPGPGPGRLVQRARSQPPGPKDPVAPGALPDQGMELWAGCQHLPRAARGGEPPGRRDHQGGLGLDNRGPRRLGTRAAGGQPPHGLLRRGGASGASGRLTLLPTAPDETMHLHVENASSNRSPQLNFHKQIMGYLACANRTEKTTPPGLRQSRGRVK